MAGWTFDAYFGAMSWYWGKHKHGSYSELNTSTCLGCAQARRFIAKVRLIILLKDMNVFSYDADSYAEIMEGHMRKDKLL